MTLVPVRVLAWVAALLLVTGCPNAVTPAATIELRVNGVVLDAFYTEAQTPPEAVNADNVAHLASSDRIETSIEDGYSGWRSIDLRFYDQVPSDAVEPVAEVMCTNINPTRVEQPLFELPANFAAGPVELVECADTPKGMRVVVDISRLAGTVWVVVPVIWWPATESDEFTTASWLFATSASSHSR